MNADNGQDLSREDPKIKVWRKKMVVFTRIKSRHRKKLVAISIETRKLKIEVVKCDDELEMLAEMISIFQNAQLIRLKQLPDAELDDWELDVLTNKRLLEERIESKREEVTGIRPGRKPENKIETTEAGDGKEKD